jgi:hypothetical protein
MAHRSRRRTGDRRRQRLDAADGRIRSRAWSDAVRTLARDPGARVPCPACADGVVSADWLAFKTRTGGEWVAQCVSCGAWYTEVRAHRDRG